MEGAGTYINVDDFKIPIPDGEKLEVIFSHQLALMDKYHLVEENNLRRKLPDPHNIDLDAPEDQLRMKEFAWRITEELAEATECLVPGEINETHFLEELIDALHFSVEFDMMSKITPADILEEDTGVILTLDDTYNIWSMQGKPSDFRVQMDQLIFKTMTWQTVEEIGTAMNTLKNKPWKSSHMITDRSLYREHVIKFNHRLLLLLFAAGLNPTTLTQLYLNKNAVNQFRIRSNY